MTTFRAGTLKDRINIQRRTSGKNRVGQPLPDAWENITPTRIAASVLNKSGMGAIKAEAEVSIVRASIRIRRRSDVDAGMRVLFGTATYDIEAVLPGSSREFVDLVCKKAA